MTSKPVPLPNPEFTLIRRARDSRCDSLTAERGRASTELSRELQVVMRCAGDHGSSAHGSSQVMSMAARRLQS